MKRILEFKNFQSDEEKSDLFVDLAKILVNFYGKNGKLIINAIIPIKEHGEIYVEYITTDKISQGRFAAYFCEYYEWFLAGLYDYLINKYEDVEMFLGGIKFIGESKNNLKIRDEEKIGSLKSLIKILIKIYGIKAKNSGVKNRLIIEDQIPGYINYVSYVTHDKINIWNYNMDENEFLFIEDLNLQIQKSIYDYLIDKYGNEIEDWIDGSEFIGESKNNLKISDEEKADALKPLMKVIVSLYGKNGQLDINKALYFKGHGTYHIKFITLNKICRNILLNIESYNVWFLAGIYDYLIGEYGNETEDWIDGSEFIGESLKMNDIDYQPGKTSINQVSYGLKFLANRYPSKLNLDYGGGKYDTGTKYLKEQGIENLVYDIFNRTEEHNEQVINKIEKAGGADSVTLLNVLNTIREKSTRLNVLKHAWSMLKIGGVMIVSIYVGDKTGKGVLTKINTWQENKKIDLYISEIEETLSNFQIEFKLSEILVLRKRGLKSLNEGVKIMSEDEKAETFKKIAKVLVNLYSKTGQIELNTNVFNIYNNKFYVKYITTTKIVYNNYWDKNECCVADIATCNSWFLAKIYDIIANKYTLEDDFEQVSDFIGESLEEDRETIYRKADSLKNLVKIIVKFHELDGRININNYIWTRYGDFFIDYITTSHIKRQGYLLQDIDSYVAWFLAEIYDYLVSKYEDAEIILNGADFIGENFFLKTEGGSTIKRCPKYGVGKDIGDSIYIHKDYATDVVEEDVYHSFVSRLDRNFEFNIVKIKKDGKSMSFINAPGFDTEDEPALASSAKVDMGSGIKYQKYDQENPPIYHHKWLFVKDDYEGFDIDQSKKRSAEWLSRKGIDFSRIGYKRYWDLNFK